jgi:hypothetical protein
MIAENIAKPHDIKTDVYDTKLQRSAISFFKNILSYQYHGPKSDILSGIYHFKKVTYDSYHIMYRLFNGFKVKESKKTCPILGNFKLYSLFL